ncbi:MAG: thioesterase family protein [Candidatus Bathyarchaeia archaeon]
MGLEPGRRLVMRFKAGPEHSASHLGSGGEVLSTPSLIAFMERACKALAEPLPEGQTTVGVRVDVYHLRAAPIGAEIEVSATLLSADGRRLTFWVEAFRGNERIGQGIHERRIIDEGEFLKGLKGS